MFFKCDEMSLSTALTVKTMLVFLEYIFQFFINKALTASNSVDRQNFVGKSVTEMINLTEVFNITVDSR